MNIEFEKCYMCDEMATSREHVPPKCLFPESKDVDEQNFREELVTVPSCEVHNSKKSKDDEFLMVSLAGIIGNNSIGFRHKLTKIDRAIRRSSGRLIEEVFLKQQKYAIELKGNKFIEVIWGTPNYKRLESCFEHIAFGIFRHHFMERFRGKVKVLLGYLYSKDKNSTNFIEFVKHKAQIELTEKELFGKNGDIFCYQFTEKDEFGLFLLRMCFYGGVDIYISFIPENVVVPANLGMELMKRGIKTYISLEGKTYEFN
jgi:hypothetical protein